MKTKLRNLFAVLILVCCAFSAWAVVRGIGFEGKIGRYSVYGDIYIHGNTVSGTYSYDRYSNGELYLSGSCRALGNNKFKLIMTERNSKGQVSGHWDVIYVLGGVEIYGTMKNRKGQTFKVRLEELGG